jgi:SAM-dependent methyltransferase
VTDGSPPPRLREGDIRPDELMDEQARRYAADVAWLMERADRFVEVPCPACGADEGTPEWKKYELDYLRCGACRTVYVSPRPEPELLGEYYRSSTNYEFWNDVIFPASEDARRERIFKPRAERVAEIVERHGRGRGTLIDVGAGFGTFCEEVAKLGIFDRVIALEPEPHLAETCRSKGLEVIESPFEDADLSGIDVDVVTNFEVIEHLFSPRDFVATCASLVDSGALFVVTCPNVDGFDIAVMGEVSTTVDAEHLNYMNPRSLGDLMQSEGFEVVEGGTPGRLDAELVRKKVLAGEFSLAGQPFLEQVLLDRWDEVGDEFQDFLADNGLSSNMWLVGKRA